MANKVLEQTTGRCLTCGRDALLKLVDDGGITDDPDTVDLQVFHQPRREHSDYSRQVTLAEGRRILAQANR